MSVSRSAPAGLGITVISFLAGAAAAGGCMAGFASWMVHSGHGQAVAFPLAAVALGFGCFFSGWFAAFVQKKRGLLLGAVQSGLYACVLLEAVSLSGGSTGPRQMLCLCLLAACGCSGGFLGMVCGEKHRRI